MNIVYLDFDGPICTRASYAAVNREHTHWAGHEDKLIVPELVRNVDTLCRTIDAKIVISSSWRRWHSLEQLTGWLREKGLTVPVIRTTAFKTSYKMSENKPSRGGSIFTDALDNGIDDFLAIDDDLTCYVLGARWIEVDFNHGFDQDALDMALARWEAVKRVSDAG